MEKAPWETEENEIAPWDSEPQQVQAQETSPSFGDYARKFAQGAAMGFLPRVAGALEAGGQAIGLKGLGGKDVTNIEFQRPELLDPEKLGQAYETAKKDYEQNLEETSKKAPVASGALELAGALAMPMAGGKATTLGAKMLKGAASGAISGYGYSKDDENKLANMGSGALIGGVLPVAEKGIEKGIKALPKLASSLTGVTEKEIETYAKHADQINKLAQSSDKSTIEAADKIRASFDKSIQSTKSKLNDTIKNTLQNSTQEIDATPIIQHLENAKNNINDKFVSNIPYIKEIEGMIDQVKALSKNGKIGVSDAHELKQFFQDTGEGAFRQVGQIFNKSTKSEIAAVAAGNITRKLVNEVAPEVAQANNQLAKLHTISKQMNNNILKVGSTEAGLMGAGTGGNPRNARALKQLGELTGTPMLEQAENLAAMRTFTNPSWLPVDTTGKSLTRMAIGASMLGAGGMTDNPYLGVAGAALTSPAMLKGAIDVGRLAAPALKPAIQKLTTESAKEQIYKGLMQKYLSNPENRTKEQPQEKQHPDTSMIMDKVRGSEFEQVLQNALNKGKDSFAAANYVLGNRNKRYQELMGG